MSKLNNTLGPPSQATGNITRHLAARTQRQSPVIHCYKNLTQDSALIPSHLLLMSKLNNTLGPPSQATGNITRPRTQRQSPAIHCYKNLTQDSALIPSHLLLMSKLNNTLGPPSQATGNITRHLAARIQRQSPVLGYINRHLAAWTQRHLLQP